jgi:hypothetical protein
MKVLRFDVALFAIISLAMMAGPAVAAPPPMKTVPEPSTLVAVAGLAGMGFIGLLSYWRKPRR